MQLQGADILKAGLTAYQTQYVAWLLPRRIGANSADNPVSNYLEFEGIRNEAGRNSFFPLGQMRSLIGLDALKQLAGSGAKKRIAK